MRSPLPVIALALASATLIAAPPARAAWTDAGVQIGGVAATGHWNVALHHDGLSGLLAAWRVQGATGFTHAQAHVDIGAQVDPGWTLTWIGPTNGFTPDGTGGAFYAYTSSANIYLDHVAPNGAHDPAWPGGGTATPGDTIAATTSIEFYPSVTADGTGGGFIAWVDASDDELWLHHVLANGHRDAAWPAAGRVVATDPNFGINSWPPQVRADGTGGVYALWIADQPRVVRYTGVGAVATGWPAAGLQLGTSGSSNAFQDVLLALMPSGPDHWIAAWFDSTAGGPRRIWVQRFHRDGTLAAGWPAAGVLALDAATNVGGFKVVSDGAGGAYVGWQQGTDVRAVRVVASGVLATGWPAGGRSLLDAAAAYPGGTYPSGTPFPAFSIATGLAGGVMMVWEDLRDAGKRLVRARWVRGDGTPDPAQPDSGRVVNRGGQAGGVRALLDDGAGGAYVAWENDDAQAASAVTLRVNYLPYSGPLDVPAGRAPELARLLATPNPARTECTVRFALAGDTPARLELLDLAGRRVRTQAIAGAGEHAARFERLDALPPGVYLVRLTERDRVRMARIALVR